jgi:flagellar assembly protein FliH
VEPYRWGTDDVLPVKARAGVANDPLPDIAAVEREAFLKGYAQGEKAGSEAAGGRADGMVRRLTESIEEVATLRAEMLHRSEQQTVQLALAIAERVVQREIALDRSLLVGMARSALDRLADYASATIRLHPDDYAVVAAGLTAQDTHAHVQIAADPTVSRGGCLVQADFGFMDVSHQAQFEELARVILDDGGQARAVGGPEHGHAS